MVGADMERQVASVLTAVVEPQLPDRTAATDSSEVTMSPTDSPDKRMESLYRRHYPALVSFAVKLTLGDMARAEDIAQETMARAWRHITELDMARDAARPWLYTVARRIAIDGMRARSARPAEINGSVLEYWPAADDGIDRAMTALDVRAALETLPIDHRAVLVNLYLRGCTTIECAELMGIPVGTVKSRAFNALRTLRRSLTGEPAPG
jgi:RNA polymerase sigma-70 factor, ECF subfamily